jgi:C_GCAxxG_C_C family probable redox protein
MTARPDEMPVQLAVSLFGQGFTCSQAILGAFCSRYGLDQATALKVSCAYGGGMASTGETCGAVTGALMTIGLAHGRSSVADQESKARTYALTKQFWNEFRSRRGTLVCRELLGVDISTPEGSKQAQEAGLFRELCPRLVKDAAEILEHIL